MKELDLVKKWNGQAGRCLAADLALDGIARFGHLVFVAYGLWLWFGGRREEKKARRTAALTALFGVAACSLLSWCIGRLWHRTRPFARDGGIWNFTGHKANASFPSNHTMNGAVVAAVLLRHRMPGAKRLAAMAALLGASRIFAGIHYPTDIFGGTAIAWAVEKTLLTTRLVRTLAARGAALSMPAEARLFGAVKRKFSNLPCGRERP